MRRYLTASLILATLWLPTLAGCGSKSSTQNSVATAVPDDAPPPKALLGIEPFNPPTLAELDAKVEWKESPVVDSKALRREKIEANRKPLVTVQEALAMKNDSSEANEKIVSALGAMPTDDSQVNYDASITRRLTMDVRSLNPVRVSSISESELLTLTGAGLVSFDCAANPFADAEFGTE